MPNNRLKYELIIEDNGAEDKNIQITLMKLSGKFSTRVTVDALVPAINQLKQTLCDDIEAAF